ncbi:PAS domain S-box protein [Ideonella sp. DXS22W]|uniref:histidine kinase n=1 Tax=Pseudaquabacterium inlustre TaxID=2984192 RepID=A0ABU9CC61_9BURK
MSKRSEAGLRRQLLSMSAGAAVLCLVAGFLGGWLMGVQRSTGLAALWPLLALAALAAVILAGLDRRLAQRLDPLARLVAHCRTLTQRVGERFDQPLGSREERELAAAINEASGALAQQVADMRAVKARLQTLLGAVPDAILGLDEQLNIVVANPAVASVFGIETRDAIGQGLVQLLPACSAEWAREQLGAAAVMSGSGVRVARAETEGVRGGSTSFPVELSISEAPAVAAGGGLRYTVVVRDQTEKRWADDQLRLYQRALEATANGVVIADMSWPGAPLVYANPAFAQLTGWARDEIIGMNCRVLQGTDRDQPGIAVLREAIAAGQPAHATLRNYRKDGTPFFNELALAPVHDAQDKLTHYVGIINDVTQREAARRALADRSARLDTIFRLSPDGFVLFDGDGWLAYCNPAFAEMTGWQADRVIGMMNMEAFDTNFALQCDAGQPYAPIVAGDAAAADPSDTAAEEEVTMELMRPVRRTLRRAMRRTMTETGETILFFRDVTRETEVDRMKSEFLTTAAHELRTPMASIFGFSELLLRRPVPDDRRRDMVETIHRQAAWLIQMLNELLDLARIEARQGKDMKPAVMRVGELIDSTLGSLMVPGDTRQVALRVEHGDAAIHVDAEKTRQALLNVISNAYKYSPGGGAIEVSVVQAERRGRPSVGILVSDQGIGMTPSQLQRVCERFYRADPSGNIPGTGLGMSLVKEIVELQGGEVQIDSELGAGTQVTLWLPLANEAMSGCQELAAA